MQDRVPPQNIEAEQSVIGAMLIDRNVNQKILFCDLVGRMYLSF